ncbi:MAG: hypothetical protein ACRDFX_08380, partial [Chloroflexota bacterium]
LAYLNGLVLSRRVDLAAATGDMAGAMMVMQLGLLVSLTIVGVVIVILLHFSIAMALAAIAGFSLAHLAILATFYLSHGRSDPLPEIKTR